MAAGKKRSHGRVDSFSSALLYDTVPKSRSKFYAVERITEFIALNCIISLRVPAMSSCVDLINSIYRAILTSKSNRINTSDSFENSWKCRRGCVNKKAMSANFIGELTDHWRS